MSNATTNVSEYDAIEKTIQPISMAPGPAKART